MENTRDCTACKGTGIWKGFELDGQTWPDKPCGYCEGSGFFTAPNLEAIRANISGRKAGTLRSARPGEARDYFVWRIARFHGGADVTMPVMAEVAVEGDPFKPELEALAVTTAKEVFGSDMRGAHAWGKALGYA